MAKPDKLTKGDTVDKNKKSGKKNLQKMVVKKRTDTGYMIN